MVRIKRRYVVFKIETKRPKDGPINDQDFLGELVRQVAQSYGDFGVACLKRGHSIKRHDASNGYMILQVRLGVESMVMSVMPLVTRIGEVPCRLNIVHLSGTIRGSLKHLRLNYIRNLRETIGKRIANKPLRPPQSHTSDSSAAVR